MCIIWLNAIHLCFLCIQQKLLIKEIDIVKVNELEQEALGYMIRHFPSVCLLH